MPNRRSLTWKRRQPPLTPADMANYCVYENRIYSLGAGLCFGKTSYTCVPSIGPATGNRAFWTKQGGPTGLLATSLQLNRGCV